MGRYFRAASQRTLTRKRWSRLFRSCVTRSLIQTLKPKRRRMDNIISFHNHLSYGLIFWQISPLFFLSTYRAPKTPIELAIDFILHDFEMAGNFFITFILTPDIFTEVKRLVLFVFYRGGTNIDLCRFWRERISSCWWKRVRAFAV